jgi:hypothetical protein
MFSLCSFLVKTKLPPTLAANGVHMKTAVPWAPPLISGQAAALSAR